MSNIYHLQQVRAIQAFQYAEEGNEEQIKSPAFNYFAAVQQMPILLKTNGLSNTLAYCYSKEGAQRLLFEQIRQWLGKPESPISFLVYSQKGELAVSFMQAVLNLENDKYRMAQQEVLLLVGWLVRFAKKPESITSIPLQDATS